MLLLPARVLRATTNPGVITSFPSKPRAPRPLKNPLLAAIPLYRLLLRTHRTLPPDLRVLGDAYLKSEFRLHRTTENPIHIIGFLSEWQKYAQELKGDAWRGSKIDKEQIERMSEEQVGQLFELMQATKNANALPTAAAHESTQETQTQTQQEQEEKTRQEVDEIVDRITQKSEG